MNRHDTAELDAFIVKRAFRRGWVRRDDVIRAFGVSPATATRALARADRPPLERKGHQLVPKTLAQPPAFATEDLLLDQMDSAIADARQTGLFDNELPIVRVQWTDNRAARPGLLTDITQAIANQRSLRIVYLGVREGAEPRWRRIAPLALERISDQWRVIAQDLTLDDFPLRSFVLARILEVAPDHGRLPPGYFRQGFIDRTVRLRTHLDPRLSRAQRDIARRELRIDADGYVSIAQRSIFEFKRRFCSSRISDGAIWPPLSRVDDDPASH